MANYALFSVVILVAAVCLTFAQDCRQESFARYSLTFEGLWKRSVFPKQYPLWRPPAQWTNVVGRSHDADYVLWREGTLATAGLKLLTEVGKTEELDRESQGSGGILDVFKVPALKAGVGTSKADFFVDSNHPRVSLVSKINPSPDWFVGVDNVMLCKNGQWVPEMTMELGPWDAGTDKGFTFTAPNWPDVPQVPIYRITSQFPDHPANGFYYPEKPELPTLAKVTFKRVDTYRLQDGKRMVYDHMNSLDNSGEVYSSSSYKNAADQPNAQPNNQPIVYEELPTPKQVITTYSGNEVNTQVPSSRRRRPKGGRGGRKSGRKMGRKPNGRKEGQAGSGTKPAVPGIPIDCEVSDWTEWATCSKTCGFGTRARRRYVAVKPENGGAPCPILVEDELCGSMRSCGWKHFRFGPVFRN